MRSDDSLATILLVSRVASDGLQPLKAAEYWELTEHVENPGELLRSRSGVNAGDHGGKEGLASRIDALLGRATAMAFELERLDQSGIATLTPFDEGYPGRWRDRLGPKAPPVVHAAGDVSLLAHQGIGVVGSRDVTLEGADVAAQIAKRAVGLEHSLVSGAARGVDQLAMSAAFDAGGSVVGILAESLARTLRKPDVRRAIHSGTTVLCTPYAPDAPFNAGNAMGRNKLIYAQSAVTIVVASDADRGGTWSGAVEALRHGIGRVGVWRGPGEGPGNEAIEARGATALRSVDDIAALLALGHPPAAAPDVSGATQPSLFES